MRDHREKRLRRCDCRVARFDGARCILEQDRELRGGFGRKIVAVEIEVHDILHFVCAAHHEPRWRTCIRTSIADASPVIATNVEKARDHHPALHLVQPIADKFDQSADHVAVWIGRNANSTDPRRIIPNPKRDLAALEKAQ